MKIVRIDNYARETVSEKLVAENIQYQGDADVMLKALQENPKKGDEYWYKIEQDDYQLHTWEP